MKRILMMVLIGAIPVAMLALVSHYVYTDGPPADEVGLAFATGLGALWGFITGVFRRSLLRTMIGLNVGGACGFGWFKLAEPMGSASSLSTMLMLLALTGGIAGALIHANKKDVPRYMLRGFLAGTVAFAFMGYSSWFVSTVLTSNLFGWTVMCLVPFGGGIAIFLALIGRETHDAAPAVVTPINSLPEQRDAATHSPIKNDQPVGVVARID